MVVKKVNGKWAVVHTHAPNIGKIIKSFPGTAYGKAKAMAMHKAIMISKARAAGHNIPGGPAK